MNYLGLSLWFLLMLILGVSHTFFAERMDRFYMRGSSRFRIRVPKNLRMWSIKFGGVMALCIVVLVVYAVVAGTNW